MYAFTYQRPTTVRAAAALLAKAEDAKLIAGGQTLLPTMKLRLASPQDLIDLGGVEGLARHRGQGPHRRHRRDDRAMPTWRPAPGSREAIPASRELAGLIGDPAVRASRHDRRLGRQQRSGGGLSGGAVWRSAPPSSPTSARSRRTISSPACSRPRWRRARSSPRSPSRFRSKAGYEKFRNPASRYALVGVFVAKRGREVRVAVTGAGSERRVPRIRVPRKRCRRGSRRNPSRASTIAATDMNGDIHAQRRVSRPSDRRAGQPRGGRGEHRSGRSLR